MAQVKERGGVGKKGISPFVPFLVRPKPKIRFLGLSLLRNQTETLATQANKYNTVLLYLFIYLFFIFRVNELSNLSQFDQLYALF